MGFYFKVEDKESGELIDVVEFSFHQAKNIQGYKEACDSEGTCATEISCDQYRKLHRQLYPITIQKRKQ